MNFKEKFCYERPKWLTIELENKVRVFFEDKYKRSLKDNEVWQISINLSNFVEDIFRCIKCKNEIHSVFPKIN